VLALALQAGYRHIDTAQSYGTEQGVGKALAASGISRDELYITSKLSNDNHRPDDVRRSYAESLKNIGVEKLDLFLLHWPLPTRYEGDYVSTWKAMTELVDQGRLRSAGVSNFQPAHLRRIIAETGIPPAVNQFEVHPYFANDAACAESIRHGVAVEAHSPLGHNRLPLSDETIIATARSREKTPAQIILRWHIQHGRIAIPKSSHRQRIEDNINVFDFELTVEEMASIDALDRGETGRVGPNPDTFEGI
jgi:2,5-diketo-D-gluconate reductase A